GVFGSHLAMHYYAYPENGAYSNEARESKWNKGEGNCGKAWEFGKLRMYDSKDPKYRNSMGRLETTQAEVVNNSINSWLSVPIRYNDAVVGVLNLDSGQNLDRTRFADRDVYLLAEAYARDLTTLCPQDGVKA
ncbi:MAG: GAF domain-containing protein, partial [Rubrobacteraceae bacterium]